MGRSSNPLDSANRTINDLSGGPPKAHADYSARYRNRNALADKIKADQTIDNQSRSEFLDILMNKFDERSDSQINQVSGEYAKAIEGIDPKFKSRKATEEYYKALVDKPGAKQTRSPDLLMSNAYQGVIGR